MENSTFLMINGTGRSGTTIIKDILSQHPEISHVKGRETRLLSDPFSIFSLLKQPLSPYEKSHMIEQIYSNYNALYRTSRIYAVVGSVYRKYLSGRLPINLLPKYLGVNGKVFYSDMLLHLDLLFKQIGVVSFKGSYIGSSIFSRRKMYFYPDDIPNIENAIEGYLQSFFKSMLGNNKCYIEDNPFGFYNLPYLNKYSPVPIFNLFIMRDPRDIVASSLKTSWGPDSIEKCAQYIKIILDNYIQIDNVDSVMKLEDFISSPNDILDSICQRINVSSYAFNLDKITDNSVGRFNSFSNKHIDFLNEYFAKELHAFGYN